MIRLSIATLAFAVTSLAGSNPGNIQEKQDSRSNGATFLGLFASLISVGFPLPVVALLESRP